MNSCLTDIQWLEREAAYCRRMDYAEPAERYERIAKSLTAASAIEARRAETPSGSVADESAAPQEDAHD